MSPIHLPNSSLSKTPPASVKRLTHEFQQDFKEYTSPYNYDHQTPSRALLTDMSNNLIHQDNPPGQTSKTYVQDRLVQ